MKTISLPIDEYIDLLTRSGLREFGVVSLERGREVAAIDNEENFTHVEYNSDCATIWRIKDWRESSAKREKLIAMMNVEKAKLDTRSAIVEAGRQRLIAKLGEVEGTKVLNQILSGQLPAVAAKLGFTWLNNPSLE